MTKMSGNDYEEFMEEIQNGEQQEELANTGSKLSKKSPPPSSGYDPEWDDGTSMKGEPVQYGFNGSGIVPTTKTVPRMPAGIYHFEFINDIVTMVPQPLITDDLVRLPDSKSDTVINEIERFWTLAPAFKKLGFTHKRGFMLYGPPGSGKTSTVSFVIKQHVKEDGVVLLASNSIQPNTVALMLGKIRKIEPERRVLVLIEDIDAILEQYGESDTLSLLDGETSIDNIVFIATTNYPQKLDPRVINRPSRFDKIVKIDVPNAESRKLYIESRKLPLTGTELSKWVEDTNGLSIAHIKELIVGVYCYGNDYAQELSRLRDMFKRKSSEEDKSSPGFSRR